MMIDFATPIRDLKGLPVKVDGEDMTLGSVSIAALQQMFQNEDASAEVKVKRFKIAVRIANATAPLALTVDDVTIIKGVVGKFWNAIVVGRVFEALDPASMAETRQP